MARPLSRLLALALALVWAGAPARGETVRRFALFAGNDDGGAGTRPLYYAGEDARKMHALLVRLGGVRPEDARLLLDGDAAAFLAAFDALARRAAEARARGERTALLVYYSGHAEGGALCLGESRLPLTALEARLKAAPADVRIGVVDSCRSGLATRLKGARRAPAFALEDGAVRARGTVVLTSSSANEDSQESDHIRGSYFTHHLVSGLLGDADRSGDGRVTLSEAYAYAYERTVASTASTSAGPQHPTFDYDLAGNGDVVLTDLSRGRQRLELPASAPGGTYFLVDDQGRVVAEVRKGPGEARTVALAPGRYRVKRRLDDRLRIGEVNVRKGGATVLDEGRLSDAPFADDPVKGPGREGPRPPPAFLLTGGVQGFVRGADLFPATPLVGVETELPGVFGQRWLLGIDLAFGGSSQTLAVDGLGPLPYRYAELGVGVSVLHLWRGRLLSPFAGARVGFVLMQRRFEAMRGLPDQFFSTLTPGLVVGTRLHLTGGLSLTVRGRLHYLAYRIDEDRSLAWTEAALGVVYEP